MTFSCACPACEHTNDVEWSRIGRQTDCGGCGKPFVVPAPMEVIERPKKTRDLIRFRCPACGKKYSTSGKLVGQKIRCKGCGGGVRVPAGDASPTPSTADSIPIPISSSGSQKSKREAPSPKIPEIQVPAMSDDSESSLFELPVDLVVPPTSQPSPPGDEPRAERGTPLKTQPRAASDTPTPRVERDTPIKAQSPSPSDDRSDDDHESVDEMMPILEDTDILDTKRNKMREAVLSSRSEAMERVSREVAEEQAKIDQQKRRLALQRATRKKKKKGAYFDTKETLRLVGWVSAFIGSIAFLAWGYPELRFPVGGLICIIGFIVYLLGWGALKQHVAEEGAFRAIAFRFIPPYQWWYVWSRWSETRDYALFFLAGMIMTSIGIAIIKTSPNGRKAERNEQIYQKSLKDKESRLPPQINLQ